MRKRLLQLLGVLICAPFVLGVYVFAVTPKTLVYTLPPKQVSGNADYVEVTGVWASRSAGQKLTWNAALISCFPTSTGSCHVIEAGVGTRGDLKVDDFIFEIVSYADGRLVARETALCVTNTLTVDLAANAAAFVKRKRPDAPDYCDYVKELFESEIVDGQAAIKRMD